MSDKFTKLNMMKSQKEGLIMRLLLYYLILLLSVFTYACALYVRNEIDASFLSNRDNTLQKAIILNSIEERNKTIEDNPVCSIKPMRVF